MDDTQESEPLAPAFAFGTPAVVREAEPVAPTAADLPDASPGGLPTTSQLVYTAVVQRLLADSPVERRGHDSDDGYVWHGALAPVMEELWPGISGEQRHSAVAMHAKMKVNRHLKATHNMVCLQQGQNTSKGVGTLPTWWVRSTWSYAPPVELPKSLNRRERGLTRTEAGEDRVPAPVLVRKIVTAPEAARALCPVDGCGRTFVPERLGVHKKWHVTYDRLVAQAARLLASLGDDPDKLKLNAVAEGIINGGSIHKYFRYKMDLVDAARAHTLAHPAEPGVPEETTAMLVPPVTTALPTTYTRWEEFKAAMLDVIAYSNHRGLPVTDSMIAVMAADTKKPARARAVVELVAEGALRIATLLDFRNRPFKAYVPVTPWQAPTYTVTPVIETTAPALTPRQALELFTAEYDVAMAQIEQLRRQASDRTADQIKIEQLETELSETSAKLAQIKGMFV
jgi:AcrR family transcriptional regulator